METDEQTNNKPWLWKKGQSGNLKGRPKGKTLKEYTRDYLAKMTEEEREDFLDGLPKELIWKMSEGNPHSDDKLEVDFPATLINLIKDGTSDTTNKTGDSEVSREDTP